MEERMPQTPLEPGEPKESEALQEDNLEAALQELDGFEPVEWSEGDEVAQNVDVGAHELLKERPTKIAIVMVLNALLLSAFLIHSLSLSLVLPFLLLTVC